MLVLPYIRLLQGRWVAGRGARSKPLGNSSEKGTNPGPQLQARRLPSEGTRRDRGPPPAGSRRGATPTGGEEEHDAERDAPGPSRPAKATHRTARRRIASSRTCTRRQRQLLSPGRGVRAAARLQGKVLTLPNCSIFRFCCLSAAAGQVMPAGSRGERRGGEAAPRRECAAPGPAAPPSAARAAPPARLRGLRGLGAPAGSRGLLRAAAGSGRRRPGRESRSRRRARRSARPVAAAGASLGPPRRPAPSAPVLRPAPPVPPPPPPPRARLLPRRAAASASTYASAAGSGARLVRQRPPRRPDLPRVPSMPSAAAGARRFAVLIPLLLVFAAAEGERGGGCGLGEGRASLGTHTPALRWVDAREPGESWKGPEEGLEPRVRPRLKGPVPSCTCNMLTVYCVADVSVQNKGQGWKGF